MFKQITFALVAALMISLLLSTHYSFANKVKCEDDYADMKWDGINHDVNHPSKKEFYLLAYHGSLCELSKCVDIEECTNHDAVDWQKFRNSPAYTMSSEDQKKCLTHWHNNGNGQDGLVGYEVLYCGTDTD